MAFLFDTYALMEWFVWNDQNYTRYFDRIMIKNDSYVSEITPVEMYHHIYHKEGREIADIIYSSVTNYLNVASIDQDIIKHAAVFRSEMLGKKHSLSYGDCIN